MDTSEAIGNLNEQKGKLKQKFARLTHNSLLFAEGQKEEISGKRQKELDNIKKKLRQIISEL